VQNAAAWRRQVGDGGDNLGATRRAYMYVLLMFLAWRAPILHTISAPGGEFLCAITIHQLPSTTTPQ
jgi:hypothetical protein